MGELYEDDDDEEGGIPLIALIIGVVVVILIVVGLIFGLGGSDKSKMKKDREFVQQVVTALTDYYIDPSVSEDLQLQHKAALTITTTKSTLDDSSKGNAKGHAKEALEKAGITEIALKSESWNKGLGMVTLTIEIANDGTLTIKSNDPSILEATE